MPARFNLLSAALTLCAGLLIGFAGSTLAYRCGLLRVPGEGIVRRMDRELHLTAAQHEQVMEAMEDARAQVQQLRRDFRRQRRQLLAQAFSRIRAILTAEQQQRFDRSFAFGGRADFGHQKHP